MDGLLGIGSAGGQSSGADGAELASRLVALRSERAKRTPVVSKQATTAAASNERKPRTFDHVAPQGAKTAGSKRRNRRKKGKKGKR